MSLCNAPNSRLAVVDVQEKLGAAMPAKVINRVITNSMLLLRVAGIMGVPVIGTEQYPQGLGPTVADIAGLMPAEATRLEKTCFSAARAEGFMAAVEEQPERDQIVICGMEAHICVLQTALDLRAAGKQVMVVEDGICSRKLENYQNALERLRQAAVQVVSAESIVFEWLGDARHEQFRAVSALVR